MFGGRPSGQGAGGGRGTSTSSSVRSARYPERTPPVLLVEHRPSDEDSGGSSEANILLSGRHADVFIKHVLELTNKHTKKYESVN